MANKKALRLIEYGLHPVLLGSEGDDLKRPLHKGWQTAVYTPDDVSHWPPHHNVGIRCGLQRDGRALVVFDFDEEANRIFPVWRWQVSQRLRQPLVIVASGRGYHVYFFSENEQPGRTLAGRYHFAANGHKRVRKFIETLGHGRQIVSAGSRHPNGQKYRFISSTRYVDIPMLAERQTRAIMALSQSFDERPKKPKQTVLSPPVTSSAHLTEVGDCLEYARQHIGGTERVERNGDIRFLGQGGLLITADGRGWYAFSEETGGNLAALVAWHQSRTGAGRC